MVQDGSLHRLAFYYLYSYLGWKQTTVDVGDGPFSYKYLARHSVEGTYGTYDGGGYSANIGTSVTDAVSMLNFLRQSNWLTRQTRAIIGEVNIYNVNVNMMSAIRILIELPAEGGIYFKVKVDSFRPYPYVTAWDFIFLLLQIVWAICLIYVIIREIIKIVKMKKSYWNIWHALEWTVIILSALAVSFYGVKIAKVIKAIEDTKNKPGKS